MYSQETSVQYAMSEIALHTCLRTTLYIIVRIIVVSILLCYSLDFFSLVLSIKKGYYPEKFWTNIIEFYVILFI